jgi:hypothetical protein
MTSALSKIPIVGSLLAPPELPPLPTPPNPEEVSGSIEKRKRAFRNVTPTILTSGQGLAGTGRSLLGG